MDLALNRQLAKEYTSMSQKARVITEQWVKKSAYCPNCGQPDIYKYPNNKPVADFFCFNCHEDYELKSKKNSLGTKIVDGSYGTMIDRLAGNNNPNFFFLNYDLKNLIVNNFLVIPKHFFIPEIIEKRAPLTENAKRAGWIGCNVLLNSIPAIGKIYLVRNRNIESKEKVLYEWEKTLFLRNKHEQIEKGWIIDIMKCIDSINNKEFYLQDLYKFESKLAILHPKNKNIQAKIRQSKF